MKQLVHRVTKYTVILVAMFMISGAAYLVAAETAPPSACDRAKDSYCFDWRLNQQAETLEDVKLPEIAVPFWFDPTDTSTDTSGESQ